MRRAAKVDTNQSQVVRELRQIPGVSVFPTHMVGGGFPDLVVGWRGVTILVELKDPDRPPSARKLTPDEQAFCDSWTGAYMIATSAEEIYGCLALQAGSPKERLWG